ncbi:putative tRNA-binding protein YtpR [Pullulanibacillus camelliae]|uniref:Putative tRNA-binding protein YtpR n=1 Tax=Pullulanibacillus camelliae TaxID=1707096 RepID=A0A8J3DZP5_9BACL|nr:DUF4479 family protein [Pullulanibacillus camelliae]GGE55256.1 putative tRNA-binding protein YtpR [Pullulanibacillus camelliae]
MNYYYNKDGIGDVLIIDLLKEASDQQEVERKGDIATITAGDQVLGYNLFNASTYISIEGSGKIHGDQALVATLQRVFEAHEIKAELTFDALPDFIVGYVEEKTAHPDADKLSVCQVNIGEASSLQIVCGAPNIEQGQKVVVARVGAVMPSGMVIKDADLRGVASSGMICSARELGLPNAPTKKGILVLDDSETIGSAFVHTENH